MLENVKIHVQMSKVNRFGHAVSGGVTLTGLVKEVNILIGSHSSCDVQQKPYTEEEIMQSIETRISLTKDEEKIPYERCNLHDGYNSEMYDADGNAASDLPLTQESPPHIGSASIDEPEITRKSVGKKPVHPLLVPRVYLKPRKDGEGQGWLA